MLLLTACGGASHEARTVTFHGGGAFPPTTIVGHYSAAGCKSDARILVRDARLYYVHSNGGLGPADLYYDDLRLDYAHFDADACTTDQLRAQTASLDAHQRTFLLHNLSDGVADAFRAALAP